LSDQTRAKGRHHGAIVRTQIRAGNSQSDARRIRALLGQRPQAGIRGYPSSEDKVIDAMVTAGRYGLSREYVGHRLLEAGREITWRDLLVTHHPGYGGLQTGEGEVVRVGGVVRKGPG
jgi:hypothetical protein